MPALMLLLFLKINLSEIKMQLVVLMPLAKKIAFHPLKLYLSFIQAKFCI